MYYDCDGPVRTADVTPPAFLIDIVTNQAEILPLAHCYFCEGCSRVTSRRDLAEDIDSYYCPHCLENMPSSEAMLYSMRCSKCWECPVCASTLAMVVANPGAEEQTYHFQCGFCRWSSRGRLEATQPEQLISKIIGLEREGVSRQKMAQFVEAFRTQAQEQQRERELLQRIKRRSSMRNSGQHAGGSVLGLSSAMGRPKLTPLHPGLKGRPQGRPLGPWRIEDLETRLRDQESRRMNLRLSVAATEAAREAGKSSDSALPVVSPRRSKLVSGGNAPVSARSSTKHGTAESTPPPAIPVLKGLTVDEILQKHSEKIDSAEGSQRISLMEGMQRSLDEEGGGGDGISSLAQRLQQGAYGYQEALPGLDLAPSGRDIAGTAQLDAPLLNLRTWSMMPVRKPLLTKRSRRCRCPAKDGTDSPARTSAGASSAGASGVQGARQQCGRIVVKPQINPCSNPPFQKNNVAIQFIPKCTSWAWRRIEGDPGPATEPGSLAAGEEAEVIFIMANPLDTEVEVAFDPMAFNPLGGGDSATDTKELAREQNVEVLTKPFNTTIARFNDLGEIQDGWGEDTEKNTELRETDDRDVICERKMHKIVVRIRIKGLATQTDAVATAPGAVWIFFAKLALVFQDRQSADHRVEIGLRFAPPGLAGTSQPSFHFAPPARQT